MNAKVMSDMGFAQTRLKEITIKIRDQTICLSFPNVTDRIFDWTAEHNTTGTDVLTTLFVFKILDTGTNHFGVFEVQAWTRNFFLTEWAAISPVVVEPGVITAQGHVSLRVSGASPVAQPDVVASLVEHRGCGWAKPD